MTDFIVTGEAGAAAAWATAPAILAKSDELERAGAWDAQLVRDSQGDLVNVSFHVAASDHDEAIRLAKRILGQVADVFAWSVSEVLPFQYPKPE
jgi:hypothetical protein